MAKVIELGAFDSASTKIQPLVMRHSYLQYFCI